MNDGKPIKISPRSASVVRPILATVMPVNAWSLLFLMIFAFSGCMHQRTMCVASVGDVGPVVETKYRYCFKDEKLRKSGDFVKLKKAYPNVFSDDGIPFTILGRCQGPKTGKKSYGWTLACPYACSLLTLPMLGTTEWNLDYAVDLADMPDAHTEFSTCFRSDYAFAMWTPSPMLFFIGNLGDLGDAEKYKGCRIFSKHYVQIMEDHQDDSLESSHNPFMNVAYAYGLAVALKKMEDAGRVDLWKRQNRNLSNDGNPHAGEGLELLHFGREEGRDFAYSFKMRNRKGDMTLSDSREVRKILLKTIRDDYLALNPYLASSMLIVDFPVYNLKGDEIAGQAIVLRLDVRSLEYDPYTRRGVMRIRLDEGQFAEARQYVRRNIEMIVRDKGIALEAGKIPEAAEFRLLDEKMSDGLLEVTFKAE